MIKLGLASQKYINASQKEQHELDELYKKLAGTDVLPDNTPETDAGTIVKLPDDWTTSTPSYVSTETKTEVIASTKVSTVYAVSIGNGDIIPVPIGFYYVGGNFDTGVVISDNEADKYEPNIDKTSHEYATKLLGNQFIWIPCNISDYKKVDWR